MKRNFRLVQWLLRPSVVIFVGDLMDGGREWSDPKQFSRELDRFRNIFYPRSSKTLTIGVPGNHDIGFGDHVVQSAYDRYLSTFGQLNSLINVANHSVITLDTVSLSASENLNSKLAAELFLEEFGQKSKYLGYSHNILISHVPLYRPENVDCGPRRRTPPIKNQYGYQYQSRFINVDLIQPPLTHKILQAFRPALILSGDDHDDCVYHHKIDGMVFPEVFLSKIAYHWYLFMAAR